MNYIEIECPSCGNDADFFYRDIDTGEIIGCSECIKPVDRDMYAEMLAQDRIQQEINEIEVRLAYLRERFDDVRKI